jgi:hypothetical protein
MAGEVRVVLKSIWNNKGIREGVGALKDLGKEVTVVAAAIGGAMAASTVAVAAFTSKAVNAASAFSAEFEGVNQVFREGAAEVQAFADTAAKTAGISSTEALRAAKGFGVFASAAGLGGKEASSFAIDLVKAAGDMASFNDVPVEEALAAIKSGLQGQGEPLAKFGILMNDATLKEEALRQGIISTTKDALTPQQKVLAANALVLGQLGVQQGDFVNYQDTFGNKVKTITATFDDLQTKIGMDVLPAAEGLLVAFDENLMPVFAEMAETVGPALATMVEGLTQILEEAGDPTTVLGAAVDGLMESFELLTTVLSTSERDVDSATDSLSSLADVLSFIITTFASFIAFLKTLGPALDALLRGDFKTFNDWLTSDPIDFLEGLNKADGIINKIGKSLSGVNTTTLAGILAASGKPVPGGAKPPAPPKPPGAPKPDAAAEAKKRFLAVQKVIQDHQKKLAAAQKSYNAEVFKLNEESEKNVKALRERAAADQLALVNQSKKRLTDAFSSATRTALTSLFDSKTVRELTQSVRRVSAALTITTSKETERIIASSVGDVIEGLRKKILGARTLIENASKLAGLGFSQTFIEQVIEGGTETGNELAKAILEASPETQAELKRLFLDLEDVTENGMGALATKIYNEQGLATQELKKLYTGVATELNDALIAEQQRLASALVGAGLAFNLAVLEIKDEFLSALEEFDGAFAGLGSTIEAFLKKLDVTAAGAVTDVKAAMTGPGGILEKATVTENVAFKDLAPLKAVSGLVIDSITDVAGAIAYLEERISAGNRYINNVGKNSALGIDARGRVTGFEQELAALRGRAAAGSAAGTTININVKTDSTQSQAMVGRTIGNIVTKYVTTGGQVLVSGNA